ncbi:MAG: helix-turn-helix transcriptional regulator [Candidatus Devosia phytovorans]|uniref:Helix-turn-helix transcriptional regulator n=1 Tax=Candidatus Devosia phytovorans TaxID=3121372 RepID=A0AAJ5VVA5_9HYPH|nr:helix-turn-helix transcriptional regulator [Devosia sp.]WEK04741.1 MAG: helix-turn-helix transcriptional regulator [Devosia sp.]
MGANEESSRMVAGLGDRIRAGRARKQLTQERLAALADLSPITLSKIERNTGIPSLDIILRIAIVLEESPNELFGWISTDVPDAAKKRALLVADLISASERHSDEHLAALIRLLRTK